MMAKDGRHSLFLFVSNQLGARSAWRWWKDIAARDGRVAAARRLLSAVLEFARDSTPERRRQRYGDSEYDWEHGVNTTSAAVGWRDRF